MIVVFSGALWAQPDPFFIPMTVIGRERPAGLIYEAAFDRMAYVDDSGDLILADARIADGITFPPFASISAEAGFNGYAFSPDGRALALATGRFVEVYDAGTGVLAARIEPPGANFTQGPLTWSQAGDLLLFETNVPAPQALRRSENDTVVLPWLWDVAAARDERRSILPGGVEAQPFFNITVTGGVALIGDRTLVQGLPGRLLVGDFSDTGTGERIEADRTEREPVFVWRSATDPIYYLDQYNGGFTQYDTRTGRALRLPLGQQMSGTRLRRLNDDLHLPRLATRIGEPGNSLPTALGSLLLGAGYPAYFAEPTVYLLDVIYPHTPARDPAQRPAAMLLVLTETPTGSILDLITPSASQIALSPDATRLAVRRQVMGAEQLVDVYDVASGTITYTLIPPALDADGDAPFAFSGDGNLLIVDHARYNAHDGSLIASDPRIGSGFSAVVFDTDSTLIASDRAGSQRLTRWDIETGQPLAQIEGRLIGRLATPGYRSPDGLHTLSITPAADGGVVVTRLDLTAQTVRTLTIPALMPGSEQNTHLLTDRIVISPDWTRFVAPYARRVDQSNELIDYVVYEATYPEQTSAAGTATPLLYLPADEVLSQPYQTFFSDQNTFVIAEFGDTSVITSRTYGVELHSSGLPLCMVERYPDAERTWGPVWRRLALRLAEPDLMDQAQRICELVATLPDLNAINAALTPTPSLPAYVGGSTPAPINVPGVPTCLTASFRPEALQYAELWRAITADASPERAAELAIMLCEGLVSNPNQIQATPTIDPNGLTVVTPTPALAGPETVSSNETIQTVLMIDVTTGNRQIGDHLPPVTSRLDNPHWPAEALFFLDELYRRQFSSSPFTPLALSPAGTLAAEVLPDGRVQVYRLDTAFGGLYDAYTNPASVQQVGLPPTVTRTFAPLGELLPTLTPTVTPTLVPSLTPDGVVVTEPTFICPFRERVSPVAASAPPTGRILVNPLSQLLAEHRLTHPVWALNGDGSLIHDSNAPRCDQERCDFSPDRSRVLVSGAALNVMRPDGSEAIELYSADEMQYRTGDVRWDRTGWLIHIYEGLLPDTRPEDGPVRLMRVYDFTRTRWGDPTRIDGSPDPVSIDGYGTRLIAQSLNGEWLILAMPVGTVNNTQEIIYFYNTVTGAAQRITQTDSGFSFIWRPDGGRLYYLVGDRLHEFNPATGTHLDQGVYTSLPALDEFAPDGRQHARWMGAFEATGDRDGFALALQRGDLPARIAIWDTDTNTVRHYCLPGLGLIDERPGLIWSPDSRYLAFFVRPPLNGDFVPTPTTTPTRQPSTATPIPLNDQYEAQFTELWVLDTETGEVITLSREVTQIYAWVSTAFTGEGS